MTTQDKIMRQSDQSTIGTRVYFLKVLPLGTANRKLLKSESVHSRALYSEVLRNTEAVRLTRETKFPISGRPGTAEGTLVGGRLQPKSALSKQMRIGCPVGHWLPLKAGPERTQISVVSAGCATPFAFPTWLVQTISLIPGQVQA